MVTRCLSNLHIYPVSFSKYGTEYKRYVLEGYDKDTEELSNQIALNEYAKKYSNTYGCQYGKSALCI